MENARKLTREQRIARDEEFPPIDDWGDRKAVCKRCHCVMRDCEPMDSGGCFYHPSIDLRDNKPYKCINAGKQFDTSSSELEPFLRKRERRILKRLGR